MSVRVSRPASIPAAVFFRTFNCSCAFTVVVVTCGSAADVEPQDSWRAFCGPMSVQDGIVPAAVAMGWGSTTQESEDESQIVGTVTFESRLRWGVAPDQENWISNAPVARGTTLKLSKLSLT